MRRSISAWVATPWRSSSLSEREPIRKWTWASLKAGRMDAPAASMTRSARKLPAPTKVMRSPSTATAERPGRDQTWPLTIARDAATERQWSRVARLETGTARASTLPSEMYLDPAGRGREKDRGLYRPGQPVAERGGLPPPGDFQPATIP